MADLEPRKRSRTLWVSSTYFAEGLPFMIVRYLAGVYLTDAGLREAHLGFLNFLGLPWNTKFLWAPAVDLFGTKRRWMLSVQLTLAVTTLLMALLTLVGPNVPTLFGHVARSAVDAVHSVLCMTGTACDAVVGSAVVPELDWGLEAFFAVLVVSAFLAATHDVSIDGYYMEAIPEASEQAAYTGLRVLTYRIAVIFAKVVLLGLAAWLTWLHAFLVASLALVLLFVFHRLVLPNVEAPRAKQAPRVLLRQYGRAFLTYLEQPKIALVLLFVITYKLGDEILFSMHTPFLMRGLSVTKEQMAWLTGLLGTGASIAGSLTSAWAIKRFGLGRAIWPLTLGMNLNIWAYVWLAWSRPDASTDAGLATIATVLAYEQFAAGLGNAVLIVYIMRTCKAEFKAAHYAIATAITSVGGTLIGGFGGILVEELGYTALFILSFVASIPSMIALVFLPLRDETPPASASA